MLALLRSQNRVLCVVDTDEMPVSHIELRIGVTCVCDGLVTDSELKKWIARMRAQEWKDTFVFFKHEDKGTGQNSRPSFSNANKTV